MKTTKDNMKLLMKGIPCFLRTLLLAITVGLLSGGIGAGFAKCLGLANDFRTTHPQIILALPIAGVAIVFLYRICRYEKDKGTNQVILALHAEEPVPFRMAPLIFVSTALTHLFGGSAGREGAALQLGGSIGNQIARWFRLDENDSKLIVMCGMSAMFSAIFGTPLAAIVFAMEVGSIGMMEYSAFFPCMISSLAASSLATKLGAHAESFVISEPLDFAIIPALKIVLLGICCAVVSIAFCQLLHMTKHMLEKYFKNAYLRILVSSAIIIGLTILLQTSTYSGAGVNLIEEAFVGDAPKTAFLWKMLFTAITLGAGFKGGEIVPSFAIGATFGSLFGTLLGLPPSLCAAVGMVSVFCAVTNCPLASLLIGFELFGFGSMKYLLIGVAVSYILSGYSGLYSEQKILFSKFKIKAINIKTH